MNKRSKISYLRALLIMLALVLAGCTSINDEEVKEDSSEASTASVFNQPDGEVEKKDQTDKIDEKSESTTESEPFATEDPKQTSEESTTSEDSTNTYVSKEDGPLAQYSSEEIEYARVWLQLGPNQQIDGLYVRHIPAGTTLEPDHFPIVSYPEDVVQLSGSRIVDGSVTYSSNGDGSINVYNVPLPGRWYGGSPTPPEGLDEETMRLELEGIINNTELVYVNPGNDEAVKKFIELLSN